MILSVETSINPNPLRQTPPQCAPTFPRTSPPPPPSPDRLSREVRLDAFNFFLASGHGKVHLRGLSLGSQNDLLEVLSAPSQAPRRKDPEADLDEASVPRNPHDLAPALPPLLSHPSRLCVPERHKWGACDSQTRAAQHYGIRRTNNRGHTHDGRGARGWRLEGREVE